jgi:cephalosporin hydroxylase
VRLSTYVVFVDYGKEVEVQHTVRATRSRIGRTVYEDLLRFRSFKEPEERHARWVDEGVLVPPFRDVCEYHGGARPGTEAGLGRAYQEWYWQHEVEAEREYRWLGRTVLKMPADLFFYQELVVGHHLRSVLEIGHGDGGGLAFFASILSLLGGGDVVGVDVDGIDCLPISDSTRDVRVQTVKGNAHDLQTVEAVLRLKPDGLGLVVIDADPMPAGKLALLSRWANLVAPGGFIVLEDVESPACRDEGGLVDGIDQFLLDRREFGIAHEAARVPALKARGAVLRRAAGALSLLDAPRA